MGHCFYAAYAGNISVCRQCFPVKFYTRKPKSSVVKAMSSCDFSAYADNITVFGQSLPVNTRRFADNMRCVFDILMLISSVLITSRYVSEVFM